jgi:hypothetical protein
MTKSGIRYSNIEPLHETSIGWCRDAMSRRPSENQWFWGTWPNAMAT